MPMPTCPNCRTQYPEGVATCETDGSELLDDLAFASVEQGLLPGTRVGEYEVEGLLGEGAFGAVYKAVHPVIGKHAAIKLLKRELSQRPEMVSRFIAEARAVNQIGHKNIIDVFNFGVHEDGRHYYVMELCAGVTLDAYLRDKGRLSPAEAMPILRQLSRALGAAHAAGIAHRDLKPENVFVTFDEGVPVPKLLDFGLAKLVHDGESAHKTKSGIPMGTPLYMSPEQVHGLNVDARTDTYAFGILAFELLTGRLPFDGGSVMDIMMKQVSAKPPKLSSFVGDLPPELDGPIDHMLEKDPNARPATIVQAADELEAVILDLGLLSGPPMRSVGPVPVAAISARGGSSAVGIDSGAATIVGPPPFAANPPTARSSKRWPLALAIATGGIAIVGIGLLAFQRPSNGTPATSTSSSIPTASAVVVAKTSAPIVTPSDSVESPSQDAPKNVKLRLEVTPSDSEVFVGPKRLGKASDALELPRGTDVVRLTIKRAGYLPATLDVTPKQDVVDSVKLKPTAQKDYTF